MNDAHTTSTTVPDKAAVHSHQHDRRTLSPADTRGRSSSVDERNTGTSAVPVHTHISQPSTADARLRSKRTRDAHSQHAAPGSSSAGRGKKSSRPTTALCSARLTSRKRTVRRPTGVRGSPPLLVRCEWGRKVSLLSTFYCPRTAPAQHECKAAAVPVPAHQKISDASDCDSA